MLLWNEQRARGCPPVWSRTDTEFGLPVDSTECEIPGGDIVHSSRAARELGECRWFGLERVNMASGKEGRKLQGVVACRRASFDDDWMGW